MKVRALRNLGAGLPPLKEGEEADIPGDIGRKLVAAGLAASLEPTPAVIQAVPAPAVLTTEPIAEKAIAGTDATVVVPEPETILASVVSETETTPATNEEPNKEQSPNRPRRR